MYRQIHIFTYYKSCYSSAAVVQRATPTGPRVWAGKTMTPCQTPAVWWRVRGVDRTRGKHTQRSVGGSSNPFHLIAVNRWYSVFWPCAPPSGLYLGHQALSAEKPGVGRCCLHCTRSHRGKLVDLHHSIWCVCCIWECHVKDDKLYYYGGSVKMYVIPSLCH